MAVVYNRTTDMICPPQIWLIVKTAVGSRIRNEAWITRTKLMVSTLRRDFARHTIVGLVCSIHAAVLDYPVHSFCGIRLSEPSGVCKYDARPGATLITVRSRLGYQNPNSCTARCFTV